MYNLCIFILIFLIFIKFVSSLSGSKLLQMSNLQVSAGQTGIYLDEVRRNVSIFSSNIYSENTGLYTHGGGNMVLASTEICSQREHGISLYYGGTVQVTDSVFAKNKYSAILVHYPYRNSEEIRLGIANCTFSDNSVGILLKKISRNHAGEFVLYVSNSLFKNNDDAILNNVGHYYDPTYKLELSFFGNVVRNNTRGITYLNDNYNWNIVNNTFESSNGHMIKIKSSGSINMHNNEFKQATCRAREKFNEVQLISVTTKDDIFLFEDNYIHDNYKCYVLVYIESNSARSEINNNRFQNNEVYNSVLSVVVTNPESKAYKQNINNNTLEENKAASCGISQGVTLTGSREIVITGNVFNNVNLTYELANQLYTVNDTFITDASFNYWGVDTAKEILNRIWDGRHKIWTSVTKYHPFYTNIEKSKISMDTSQMEVIKNENVLSGRIDKSVTLSNTNVSYILKSSLIVSRGAALTVKEGVSLFFSMTASLVVYGQLEIQGTELNPVFLKKVIVPEEECSKTSMYLLRLSGGSSSEGILEFLDHDGYWYPFCEREWTAENTRTACTQLGLGKRMYIIFSL